MQLLSTLEEAKEEKKAMMVFHKFFHKLLFYFILCRKAKYKGISTKDIGAHQDNQIGETKEKRRSVKSELLR